MICEQTSRDGAILLFVKHHVLDWGNVPNQIIKRHGPDLMGFTGCEPSALCLYIWIKTRCYVPSY